MIDQLPAHSQSDAYIFVDEVGRGCLAGPVVVGGVLWRPQNIQNNNPISWQTLRKLGVDDSKKVKEKKRLEVLQSLGLNPLTKHFESIEIDEDNFGLTFDQAEVFAIEKDNILFTTMHLMQKVVLKLCYHFNVLQGQKITIFIDGREKIPNLENQNIIFSQVAMPKADSLLAPMGLASLVAKVYRDHQMQTWDRIYPQFDLGKHKGYGTAKHLLLIKEHGPSPIHRRTFAGVKEFL